MTKFNYGGQAVIEGVMMRGEHEFAVAARKPSGEIAVHRDKLNETLYGRLLKIPFLRGLVMLWDSMGLGLQALMWSGDTALEEEEDVSFSGPAAWGTVAVSLLLGVGLFFVLPMFITTALDKFIISDFWSNVVEGLVRLAIFLIYLSAISLMPDIRRVFAYHGAEHKTINAYEAGAPLIPEEVAKYSRTHTRCGTGFLLIVMFVFILVAALFGRPLLIWRLLSRIVLIPIVAGISYEIMKLLAKNYEKHAWARILVAPGLTLQKLTTREPETDMLEVSIAALKAVLDSEGLTDEPDSVESMSDAN